MICIDAENLRDGLYNIKNGKIYKYNAKGGTVRAYELRSIVTCGECEYWNTKDCREGVGECEWAYYMTKADDFCSYGEREGE